MARPLDPRIAVGECEEGAALGAKVDRVRVECRGLAEHRRPGRPRQSVRQLLPRLPAVPRAVDGELPVRDVVILGAPSGITKAVSGSFGSIMIGKPKLLGSPF